MQLSMHATMHAAIHAHNNVHAAVDALDHAYLHSAIHAHDHTQRACTVVWMDEYVNQANSKWMNEFTLLYYFQLT